MDSAKRSRALRTLLTLVAVMILPALGCICSGSGSRSSSSQVEIGAVVRLKEPVPLALDEDAFEELIDAVIAKDKYGWVDLIAAGRVVLVDEGTEVRVIDMKIAAYRVRILEGTHTGKAGWVISEAIE